MCLVLTILWVSLSPAYSADSPQLALGDKVSIFSDKAYRKNGGRYFEAVGNVVIISQKDTIYGELASMDQDTMMVKIEGNVRIITKDMTLYGSHLEYNITTGSAIIKNARILTSDFNLVATSLIRISESEYLANDSEFTTCKDCAESWSVFGKTIRVKVGKYVQIRHGLAKIKGVNVLYLPYIVLPIMGKRKTGLLFPNISTRIGEGLAFEQPIFIAMGDSKDMTVSPTFWAQRGYGGDVQYRQRFKDLSWVEFNSRALNDTIYEPGKSGLSQSGNEFFRYFVEAESHQQWSPDVGSHFRYSGTRDLDIVRDHPQYTDRKILGSDLGLNGHVNLRRNLFTATAEMNYLRNQLYSDPLVFDRSYVQTMPRVTLASTPYSLIQTRTPGLQHIAVGFDGSYSRFRQVDEKDDVFLRNADRLSIQPYLMWHLFTWGPVSVKSRYTLDHQDYRFMGTQPGAGKSAGLMRNEISFTMDKIFGLAYEEKIPLKYISEADIQILRDKKEKGLTPIQETEKESKIIGEIEPFESDLAAENIVQVRKSYRHSQEFKFIHHYIPSQNTYGNKQFINQIKDPVNAQQAWFDYEDAIRADEFKYGATTTRTIIPPRNTAELQWNNTLVRKVPKTFSYLEDDKFLRDNFSYNRIGYFNVSQGYLMNEVDDENDYRSRLTRLWLSAGYNADRWSLSANEYYFHLDRKNIYNLNLTRRFDSFNVFANYNYNGFQASLLNTLSVGGQVRPTDVIGFAIVKDMDLEAKKDIRTIYSVDIMPHNNCWILNLNKRESLVGSRYSFNIIFNFGDDNFDKYRNDYFAVKRM